MSNEPVLLPRPRRIGSASGRSLPPQGYRLVVHDDGRVDVDAADEAGRFYAERTLAQLGEDPRPIVIEDWPDIPVRGVMLDVSRDKVPTIETLERVVDRLASFKVNQLQLYMEHTFAYEGHEEVWAQASPYTADDIRRLDAYCSARHVELVPNQNCLGHMERWLRHDRYRPLAIRPDGWIDRRGRTRPPMTLDPANPASLALVEDLLGQLLPNFAARRVHVGLDEPFELADERFEEYVDYIHRLRSLAVLDGREMLMWGDIVAEHPDRADALPPGTTVCEWGYEADHPYEQRTASLARSGLPFWVCPGTSSWNTVTGRWSTMIANCLAAAEAGARHGAAGLLVADWGDNGHLQYLPFSEPGFAWAAAVSWCAPANRDVDLVEALSRFVFGDASGQVAVALRELGDVYRTVPQLPNLSVLMLPLLVPRLRMGEGYTEGVTAAQLEEAASIIDRARARVDVAHAEILNGADLLAILVADARARLAAGGTIESVPRAVKDELADRLLGVLDRHRELWLARNREGGLDDSCRRIERLIATYAAG